MLIQTKREYPVAEDRGGIKADLDNYATFLQRLRSRLNASGRRFGISITIVRHIIHMTSRLD